MTKRSELRLRAHPHFHPDRQGETIVEIWRDGKLVATIYGTREGVQIVSDRFSERPNVPFRFEAANLAEPDGGFPSVVLPLLARDEVCPWCNGTRQFLHLGECPVCREEPK